MSMTDAPPEVGFPQSVTRWTFDLSEHTPKDILARYARYKIVLYDDFGSVPEPVSGPTPQLSVSHFDVNTLEMKTDFSRPKILVYNDSYTTSWKAYLDARPVPLLRINGAFKGLEVPAGRHTVAFAYHPPGGAWVYITATAALFIFMIGTVLMIYWRALVFKKILGRNIVLWALLALLLSSSVNWRLCTIERGKYLLGIFYNGYYQNTLDGSSV